MLFCFFDSSNLHYIILLSLPSQPNIPPARVVIEVQQVGGARKLIIIRSALVVYNRLDSPLELKLEATDESGV